MMIWRRQTDTILRDRSTDVEWNSLLDHDTQVENRSEEAGEDDGLEAFAKTATPTSVER